MDSPCKGCTERRVSCHGACERYKQWKAAHNEDTAKRRTEKNLRSLVENYRFSFRAKAGKIKQKGGRKS